MIENLDALLEAIQEAVSEYSCDYADRDFEITVKINCHDGWCKAIEKEGNRMKTENMTFSEALEAMKQGCKVKNSKWSENYYYYCLNNGCIVDKDKDEIGCIDTDDILSDKWGIYAEHKPEPQFEIGELVMMRDDIDSKWFPEHFAYYEPKREVPYMAISGKDYVQCAKFDKDIVFTNKPAK